MIKSEKIKKIVIFELCYSKWLCDCATHHINNTDNGDEIHDGNEDGDFNDDHDYNGNYIFLNVKIEMIMMIT